MITKNNHPRITEASSKGFALVVSLTMLVLLTIIAVGLLSLSAITLRTTAQTSAQSEAQANARMALMIAIGELQKQMGPDQRISANSSILSESTVTNPHWTGVWNSWKAGVTSAAPENPSEASDHQTIPHDRSVLNGMHPTYAPNRQDHFRSWLLSLNPGEMTDINAPRSLSINGSKVPDGNDNSVMLVGEGALGPNQANDQVNARLLPVRDREGTHVRGRYGWWIGDESQKARIMNDSHETAPANTVANRLFRQQAPGSMGTNTIVGLENISNSQQLSALPSLLTVGLIDGATEQASRNFHSVTPYSMSVLADVREGGLKRDLSTLLERPIDTSESGSAFMLYQFNTKDAWIPGSAPEEAVPIQDLAAYYQLYDGTRTGWRPGVQYNSNLIRNGIQVSSPNYGTGANHPDFSREYTNLYRQPVPIKLQFLLSLFAEEDPDAPAASRSNPNPSSHLLRMGITPSVTLWNPNNVPMVMNFDENQPEMNAITMRTGPTPLRLRVSKNLGTTEQYQSAWNNLVNYRGANHGAKIEFINLYFSGIRPIRFEPGEVRTFSLSFDQRDQRGRKVSGGLGGNWTGGVNSLSLLAKTDRYFEGLEVHPGWDPESFMYFLNSAMGGNDQAIHLKEEGGTRSLRFNANDKITIEVDALNTQLGTSDGTSSAPLAHRFIQSNYQDYRYAAGWNQRHYQFHSRHNAGLDFGRDMMSLGFPGGASTITLEERDGFSLIARTEEMAGWPFLQFSLQAGVETRESVGFGSGRRFASRPFLHSSALAQPFIDDITGMSLYNQGWNWMVNDINEVFEAPVQVTADGQGFYGGGYTPDFGNTHVVQQEIPVVPPISIASLSHARLGGFSIAAATSQPHSGSILAVGLNGMFPQTVQAIGNSYAHPQIPADAAFTTWNRIYNRTEGGRPITVADHSYLANKAIWDDFFFSSITTQRAEVQAFGVSRDRDAKTVASGFFFDGEPLPNRRFTPYLGELNRQKLDEMFGLADVFGNRTGGQNDYGLADRIAAHLMVEGPFNVNSTSVDAWRTLLSSLKGKPVAYLDRNKALGGVTNPDTATTTGVPVSGFNMPNARPGTGTNDPQDPDQWIGWRELNDTEIDELAEAIVRQVKLRGPFLSLSEFVNRRLDGSNTELALKGALQAALDDPSVSINAGFRTNIRQLDGEVAGIDAAFPEALRGPVAYGSAAYVDQADVLRNFASQLTPRGDTFVIRTYGDSLDHNGNVQARAWCEAVVQRIPEYFDPQDDPHLSQANLQSESNKTFGRKLIVVSFRWLNAREV